MQPTITVDVGTTSVKLCAFDASGELRASDKLATPTVADAWGEVYAIEPLTAFVTAFARGLPSTLRASIGRIAIAGVGESGGLVRADGSLASPMILWHDHRGADLLAGLSDADRGLVYRVTGLPVNANYGLSKVAWSVAHAAPGTAADAFWLNIAEYLATLLTGERWSEYSLASRTMALDLTTGTWSAEVCALLGVDTARFPPLREAHEGSRITSAWASTLGISTDVVVHVAGHDHMVGGVGAGLQPGELLNSTGTTEGLLFLRSTPSLDERSEHAKLANGRSATASAEAAAAAPFTLFASIPTGGSAFATLQTMLGMPADRLAAMVDGLHERWVAGAVDLGRIPLVLPRFRGSPPPTKRSSDRGVIAGIGSDTTADEIVLGCFLGLALQFRDVLELFPGGAAGAAGAGAAVGAPTAPATLAAAPAAPAAPASVKVIGPASENPLWLQLKADLLGVPLGASRLPEVVSRGAQAIASGVSRSWDDCRPDEIVVDPRRAAQLDEWSNEVGPLWAHLKEARQ